MLGGASRIRLLLVLLGVLGGQAALGLVGLFASPAFQTDEREALSVRAASSRSGDEVESDFSRYGSGMYRPPVCSNQSAIFLEVGYVDGDQVHVIVHAMKAREKFLR